MLQPKVLKRQVFGEMESLFKSSELWRFRGQYFKALINSHGHVYLFFSNKDGDWDRTAQVLTEWGGISREAAIKWLNDNIG